MKKSGFVKKRKQRTKKPEQGHQRTKKQGVVKKREVWEANGKTFDHRACSCACDRPGRGQGARRRNERSRVIASGKGCKRRNTRILTKSLWVEKDCVQAGHLSCSLRTQACPIARSSPQFSQLRAISKALIGKEGSLTKGVETLALLLNGTRNKEDEREKKDGQTTFVDAGFYTVLSLIGALITGGFFHQALYPQ